MSHIDQQVNRASRKLLVTGEGEPILILHGAPLMSFVPEPWPEFVEDLSTDHRVIAAAHPGFGDDNEVPEWCDSVSELALHYVDLLDSLNCSQVNAVGHSFGAWIAATLAARYPERVRTLVLANPLGLWIEKDPVPDLFMLSAPEIADYAYADKGLAQRIVPETSEEIEEWYGDWGAFARFAWVPALHDPKLPHLLTRIAAPTTIVAGAEDRITPRSYTDRFLALIPHARLELFADSGHASPLERPMEFATIVRSTITEVRNGG